MGIEVCFIPEGGSQQIPLESVGIGQTKQYLDYTGRRTTIVAVTCFDDNDGGEVHVYDSTKLSAISAETRQTFDTETLTALIPRNGTYERPITAQTRAKGRLVLRHLTYSHP